MLVSSFRAGSADRKWDFRSGTRLDWEGNRNCPRAQLIPYPAFAWAAFCRTICRPNWRLLLAVEAGFDGPMLSPLHSPEIDFCWRHR